jgi:hypothetical protein
MNQNFAAIILGGNGQVGGAGVSEPMYSRMPCSIIASARGTSMKSALVTLRRI